jgi:hypothetical protein
MGTAGLSERKELSRRGQSGGQVPEPPFEGVLSAPCRRGDVSGDASA